MFIIKSRDLIDTIPANFPHPELIDSRWHTWVIGYRTFEAAMEAVTRQIDKPCTRPVPAREYRIFEKEGRKLIKIWEGKRS